MLSFCVFFRPFFLQLVGVGCFLYRSSPALCTPCILGGFLTLFFLCINIRACLCLSKRCMVKSFGIFRFQWINMLIYSFLFFSREISYSEICFQSKLNQN